MSEAEKKLTPEQEAEWKWIQKWSAFEEKCDIIDTGDLDLRVRVYFPGMEDYVPPDPRAARPPQAADTTPEQPRPE